MMNKGSFKRIAITVAILLALILLGVTCCGERLVNKFTFFPDPGMQVELGEFEAPIEKVFVTTEDNVRVSGFYIPREGATRTFLFFHGNAGNASHRLEHAVNLWELEANVLLMDYRGYGLSGGEPSEVGIYLDAEAGLKFLLDEKSIPLDQVIVFGRSLGTAVAVHLAQNRELGGVVLVCPMSSGRDVARESGLSLFTAGIGEPFDSKSKMKFMKAPLLILHAQNDEMLPIEMGRTLYELAEVKKEFVEVKGATHNEVIAVNPEFFFSSVKAFVEALDGK